MSLNAITNPAAFEPAPFPTLCWNRPASKRVFSVVVMVKGEEDPRDSPLDLAGVADLCTDAAVTLGANRRRPRSRRSAGAFEQSTPTGFDAVIGAFVQYLRVARAPAGRRPVLSVDGKTVGGSPRRNRPGRHLFEVIDQHARIVLGQVEVAGKTSGSPGGAGPTLPKRFAARRAGPPRRHRDGDRTRPADHPVRSPGQ